MNAAITYSQLQENLAAICGQVCADHTPVVVETQNSKHVVLVAEEDYAALLETIYLLKSPANAERLLDSLKNRDNDIRFSSVDELAARLNLV